MTSEVWEPIPLFNRKLPTGQWKYEVSNLGRIRIPEYVDKKHRFHAEHIFKHQKNQGGYHTVCLSDGHGKQKRLLVSRLVAIVFIDNPNQWEYVNHLDENKDNNAASNLAWCTWNENLSYGTRVQRVAAKNSKAVRQYTTDGILVAEYNSVREVERLTGYANTNISACCRRKPHHNKQYGYIWRFVEDDEYENKN